MKTRRYSLDNSSKKYICPRCNKAKLVRYIDTQTGELLPEEYGRCDREDSCNYHRYPYGYAANEQSPTVSRSVWLRNAHTGSKSTPPETIYFDFETFRQTLQSYERNIFIQNLLHRVPYPFDAEDVTKVIELYRLGTIAHGYRSGAVTFPFIDVCGNIRTVQVKQFDKNNHTIGTDFLHSMIAKEHRQNNETIPQWLEQYNRNEKKVSCLFGEHLLSKCHSNPVALVEAPKTAVYGTLYFGTPKTPDDFIWLAVYNKSSFSFDKLRVLEGRTICVFPDLSKDGNTFKEWESKAKEYESRLSGARFVFSDLLEKLAYESEKSKGLDIADYLIQQDWRQFQKLQTLPPPITENGQETESQEQTTCKEQSDYNGEPQSYTGEEQQESTVATGSRHKREQDTNSDWTAIIQNLEEYFSTNTLPTEPIKLNAWETITDVTKFVSGHIETVKSNNGNSTFTPHLNRLIELRQILSK